MAPLTDLGHTYPNFNEVFEIHTDASDRQLGVVISQNRKPLAFYSRKLSGAQRNYTTTEQELLSIASESSHLQG